MKSTCHVQWKSTSRRILTWIFLSNESVMSYFELFYQCSQYLAQVA